MIGLIPCVRQPDFRLDAVRTFARPCESFLHLTQTLDIKPHRGHEESVIGMYHIFNLVTGIVYLRFGVFNFHQQDSVAGIAVNDAVTNIGEI
jgi:hypothetical protein